MVSTISRFGPNGPKCCSGGLQIISTRSASDFVVISVHFGYKSHYKPLYYTLLHFVTTLLHFTTLYYTLLHFTTLCYNSTTLCYTMDHFWIDSTTLLTILYYTLLQLYYTLLQHFTTPHYTLLHFTTLYYTLLHFATILQPFVTTLQCYTTLYNTLLHLATTLQWFTTLCYTLL